MAEIFERTIGYSNQMMLDDLRRSLKVLTQKEIVKKAIPNNKAKRIKGSPAVYKYKYDVPKHIITKFENSIKYYENHTEDMIELRNYQKEIVSQGSNILHSYGFVYLSMEVRTGKTITALSIANNMEMGSFFRVLFVTKKKLVPTKTYKGSILEDYEKLGHTYDLDIINYESLHKLNGSHYDVIILDEAHGMGAYPKPSKRAKQVRDMIQEHKPYVILLSGTPTPESYSQMYHQVYGIPENPFGHYKNFYAFAKDFVDVKERMIDGRVIKDYSHGSEEIIDIMHPYTLSYTQKAAGFKAVIVEHIVPVVMKPVTMSMIKKLEKDRVIEGQTGVVLADTMVKLQQKVHQMSSGTVKLEPNLGEKEGKAIVFDTSKAEYIYRRWVREDIKVAIFYKFKAELEALKSVIQGNLTTDLDTFNNTCVQAIALQVVSGREGISLKKAEALVYYNIDFSATTYWQSRDRMTTKERPENHVYWLFSDVGIEHQIYKAVSNKKDFTLKHYKEWLGH